MAKLIFSISLIVALIHLGDAQSRIVGGTNATEGSVPYHASLQSLQGAHVCGGAIISECYIISAAHCFVGAKPEYIIAVVGTVDLNAGGIGYEVTDIISHEGHSGGTRQNDIALIKTSRGIAASVNVRPIRLFDARNEHGDRLTLTGFGLLSYEGQSPNNLQTIELNVLDMQTCRYAYRNIRTLYDSQLCTYNAAGEGACKGDSGSPLVWEDYLVGLSSFGVPCAVGYPDVFTRISSFYDWIERHTGLGIY